jgi:flagellar biogenesis protein FliO
MNDSIALTLLQTIIVLIAVIVLANVSLKIVGKKLQGGGRAIEILEKVQISPNSSIAVVRILGIYYLMSLSDGGNMIIKELEGEELEETLKRSSLQPVVNDLKGFARAIMEKRKVN